MSTAQPQAGRAPARSRARALAPLPSLAMAAVLVIAACGGAAHPSSGAASGANGSPVPVPSSATVEIGFDAPGMEAGVPFVEYRSADVPATARKSYDTDLRKAGFAEVDTQAGWTVYGKDDVVLWVFVGESGPPTTIIVRYAQGDEAATILATAAAGTPGTTEPDGTPGPSGAPVVTAANPTPEPATRPTAPDRTPPGQGNKPTARPTAEPTAKPTAKPKPTAEPTAKPKPTKKPKPTHKPKPTKKPKPTPSPANGGGKGNKP